MRRSDQTFDGIAATFETDVYESTKGQIRFNVLWEDLMSALPRLRNGGVTVLDAGGGAGHLAIRLAERL